MNDAIDTRFGERKGSPTNGRGVEFVNDHAHRRVRHGTPADFFKHPELSFAEDNLAVRIAELLQHRRGLGYVRSVCERRRGRVDRCRRSVGHDVQPFCDFACDGFAHEIGQRRVSAQRSIRLEPRPRIARSGQPLGVIWIPSCAPNNIFDEMGDSVVLPPRALQKTG